MCDDVAQKFEKYARKLREEVKGLSVVEEAQNILLAFQLTELFN
jgi:hypothetical protein